jgi:hypothetical protein
MTLGTVKACDFDGDMVMMGITIITVTTKTTLLATELKELVSLFYTVLKRCGNPLQKTDKLRLSYVLMFKIS